MRYSSAVVVLLLLPAIASADPAFSIRPLDAGASSALVHGLECSATIRGLVQELAQSDLIVHVQTDWDMPASLSGATNFIAARGGYRYVRVRIDARLPKRARAIALGHELQHAVEIARSDAADQSGVRRLLEASGYTLGGRYYETDSARKVEQHIKNQR